MAYNHEAPVLCCAFSKDGQRIFSGGCDNKASSSFYCNAASMYIHMHIYNMVLYYIYISYVIYSLVVPRSLYHEVKMKVLQTQQEQQIGTEP